MGPFLPFDSKSSRGELRLTTPFGVVSFERQHASFYEHAHVWHTRIYMYYLEYFPGELLNGVEPQFKSTQSQYACLR